MSIEWTVLELLTRGLCGAGDDERLAALLTAPELSWGELLEQAIRHKLIASLAVQAELLPVALPPRIGEHLATVLNANRHRVRVLQEEACGLAKRLEAEGVLFAAVKGVVLASSLYRDSGERMMADVDFLIPPAEGPKVERILEDAGFVAGHYDPASRSVVPFTRRELIEFRLNPYHLPHRIKLLDDPLVDHVDAGFATSLAWTRAGFEVPLEPLLAATRPVRVAGGWLPALQPDAELLYGALMLYKYASFATYLDAGCDVCLAAFGDLVRLWKPSPPAPLPQAGEGRGLGGSVAEERVTYTPLPLAGEGPGVRALTWTLEHTDLLFGTCILPSLGLRWEGSEDELHQVFFAGGRAVVQAGDFRCRLQSKDRRRLFAVPSTEEVIA
ncbi:MAG TPA: nucleotidyltransferase family protein [Thermoanaerobaculia bacterium]|nr:nucleotidyltransferase family protein [Thermoanaerobaculia bacterium]